MRMTAAVVLCLAASTPLAAQVPEQDADEGEAVPPAVRYEAERKRPLIAAGLEVVLPPLGHKYAGADIMPGVLLLGLSGAGAYIVVTEPETSLFYPFGWALLLVTRAGSMNMARSAANSHNESLRQRLGIQVGFSGERTELVASLALPLSSAAR